MKLAGQEEVVGNLLNKVVTRPEDGWMLSSQVIKAGFALEISLVPGARAEGEHLLGSPPMPPWRPTSGPS